MIEAAADAARQIGGEPRRPEDVAERRRRRGVARQRAGAERSGILGGEVEFARSREAGAGVAEMREA
jgi:hypothetical protein